MAEKVPPHDQLAEENVLGAALLWSEAMPILAETLTVADFFFSRNQTIYDVCLRLWREGMPVDQVTVSHALAIEDKLDDIGGGTFLSWLVGNVVTLIHVRFYASIVHKTAALRRTIAAMGEATARLYEAKDSGEDVRAEVAAMLLSGTDLADTTWTHFGDIVTLETPPIGLPLWPDLQALLGGLLPGKMYIVAGRPSMGKSTFVQAIAFDQAVHGKVGLIVSLEDTEQGIVERFLRAHMGIDDRVLAGRIADPNEALMDALGIVGGMALWVSSRTITAENAVARIMAFHGQRPVDFIVIDYIQLFAAMTHRHSRYDQITDMSVQLATLARRLNVPILVVAQLNRGPDERPDHRPMLSDLKETGQLEQDAHVVIFLWRPGAYWTENSPQWKEEYRYRLNVIVAKNKDGPTGQLALYYDMPTGRISSWSNRERSR